MLVTRSKFDAFYSSSRPPWDTRRVQPAIAKLITEGMVEGPVLDLGCGTGATVKALSDAGISATGVDFCPTAIAIANQLKTNSSLATFVCQDILTSSRWRADFATAIDCGTLHTFPRSDTGCYVAAIRRVLRTNGRLISMCFSDLCSLDSVNRYSSEDLHALFAQPEWSVEMIARTRFWAFDPVAQSVRMGPHAFLTTAISLRPIAKMPRKWRYCQ